MHRPVTLAATAAVSAALLFAVVNLQAQQTEPNRGGELSLEAQDPQVALERLTTAEGYEVNLFASEKDFPIGNPVALNFDARGRMWVCTMPSYPQYNPPVPPDDKVVILEDTDRDGRADKHTVFLDKLHLPTGFELGDGGAYVGQQPNLMFAKDVDGDDVADVRRTVLHGFGTEDSHHAINAFTWGPDGGLYIMEGTFLHSQVETPYGPVRAEYAAVFRYKPELEWLEVFVSYPFANPWGHIFDGWGQNYIADASGGSNYFGTALSGHVDYPRKHPQMKVFTSVVRPTAGCEIVSSRHFPESAQGNFLVNNCIGFQGIKQHRVIEEESGVTSQEVENLLQSSDINFRPVDIEFGPDGALYIVDWFNPLIGHMQYSLRDERRDHGHGRIWRITAKGRPLVEPSKIDGEPIAALLELLKTYEDRTRYRVRLELRLHDRHEVAKATQAWVAGLDKNDPNYEHLLLEALWVHQTVNVVDQDLLKRVLSSPDYRARAAATRVLRYWRDEVPEPLSLVSKSVADEHPRVRLEAVLAASFLPTADSAQVALEALRYPMDYYLDYVLKETLATLEPYWKPAIAAGKPFAADNPVGLAYVLDQLPTTDLLKAAPSRNVYETLLVRHDAQRSDREQAVRGLARIDSRELVDELIAMLTRLDGGEAAKAGGHGHGKNHGSSASDQKLMAAAGDHADHVRYDLGQLLLARPAEHLTRHRAELLRLATTGKHAATRQVGYAALVTADGGQDQAWQQAAKSVDGLCSLLDAISLIPATEARSKLFERVVPLVDGLPADLAEDAGDRRALGRFVRIELPGEKRTLTLAEVEILSGDENLARSGKATQQSTGFGGEATRALDGNRSGTYGDGGQTHTEQDVANPWWEVDLGNARLIDRIRVFNRSESGGQFASRLDGFTIRVLDAGRQTIWEREGVPAPAESVDFELDVDPTARVRRAAVAALGHIPGHEAQAFGVLARVVQQGDLRTEAVRSLARLSKAKFPAAEVAPLVQNLLAHVEQVAPQERTEPAVLDAIQLAGDLAGLLPSEEAQQTRAKIRGLGVNVIVMRTVPHAMIYDRRVIAVQAGKPVEIVFENGDVMPHNLIVTAPDAMQSVALAAERMALEPDAYARNFVPAVDGVLHASRLLYTGQSERIKFVAPATPGDYPFVCTFPGHWRTMNGVMKVVEDVDAYLAANPLPEAVPVFQVRPFVREWGHAELGELLEGLEKGRSFAKGREIFAAASCTACHRVNGDGMAVGPSLEDLAKDWAAQKVTDTDMLWELVEPSKTIKEKFRSQVFVTVDGRQLAGLIVDEDKSKVRLLSNPLMVREPDTINVADIDERFESPVSLMPKGLLNTLTAEEILDLLAYLKAGGDPNSGIYKP